MILVGNLKSGIIVPWIEGGVGMSHHKKTKGQEDINHDPVSTSLFLECCFVCC